MQLPHSTFFADRGQATNRLTVIYIVWFMNSRHLITDIHATGRSRMSQH